MMLWVPGTMGGFNWKIVFRVIGRFRFSTQQLQYYSSMYLVTCCIRCCKLNHALSSQVLENYIEFSILNRYHHVHQLRGEATKHFCHLNNFTEGQNIILRQYSLP